MSNPVQSSTATSPERSLASQFPRSATLLVVLGLFTVSMGLLYATILATGLGLAVVALLGSTWLLSVLLLALVVRPYFYRLKIRTKPVPEGLDTSVEANCSRRGVALRRSWLVEGETPFGMAEIAGVLPWDRHLVADEWFFASLDPAERDALVVREAALVRSRYQLFCHAAGPAIVAAVAGLLAVATQIPASVIDGTNASLLLAAASACLYALAARRGTKTVHAADRDAARQTSRDAVVGLLEKGAHRHQESTWHRWPISMLLMRPTTKRRIERVRSL